MRHPSIRSVSRTPPRRELLSNSVYSSGTPAARFCSRAKAAESPEMPPPIMAMRFMKSRATPAKPELAESPNEAEREAEGMLVLQSQAFSKNCDKRDRVKSASAAISIGESFSDSARHSCMPRFAANPLKPISIS